ncbi:MAG: hypothetical protein QOE42_2439, partial [Chloroflexota bacterium]|nr:hypothetical protein [Chloroflexota bacterium]
MSGGSTRERVDTKAPPDPAGSLVVGGGADVPGGRIEPRIARRYDERDEDPDNARAGEEPEVGQSVARF